MAGQEVESEAGLKVCFADDKMAEPSLTQITIFQLYAYTGTKITDIL